MRASDGQPISITLSPAQVEQVLRATSGGAAQPASRLLARARAPGAPTEERRLSRSLLRGLALLACFEGEARDRGIVELAGELEMSPSTAHRYAQTLLELGLLERCPRTRRYRLASSALQQAR
jgi:DNA-binding MarR family transcriptional regulator